MLALMAISAIQAQTTFNLDWAVGINGAPASVTIEQGDTVEWTWTDELPHSVTSMPSATEAFDSGILTGNGTTYSFTFSDVGTNDYECIVHPGNMFGTITVEEALSTEDKFLKNLVFYPNPVEEQLTIGSLLMLDGVKVYDITGKLVYNQAVNGNLLQMDFNTYKTGVYFVEVSSSNLTKVFQIVKK